MMTQKLTATTLTTIILLITLSCICPITTAAENNYTICTTNSDILYTDQFLQTHPNSTYPTIEFENFFYLNSPLNLTVNEHYTSPIYRYINDNLNYLIQNPESQIYFKKEWISETKIAESYTNRNKFSQYPGDTLIYAETTREPNEPKPPIEITVYIHTDELNKYFYDYPKKDLYRIYIYNPQHSNAYVNPIYGQNYIHPHNGGCDQPKYTTQFITSKHLKEKTTQINGYTHYINQPNLTTIIDYIFTQSDHLLKNPNSYVYLNLKDHGLLLNREIIAYSREITPTEIYNNPKNLTITKIIRLKNKLPQQLLIKKTSGTDQTIGVFIDLEKLNSLEREIINQKFKWISTHTPKFYTIYNPEHWTDTIYEPQ